MGLVSFAGDTNFVAQFNAIWQTRNASNVLMFVEQNVATNASPEVFFARSCIAMALQQWSIGASNYLEQAIQMVATNGAYSAKGKTNAINTIRDFQGLFSAMVDVNVPQPVWKTNNHAAIFAEVGDEAPFLIELKELATIEPIGD